MAKPKLKTIKGHYYQLLKSNNKEEKALTGEEVLKLFSAIRQIPVNDRKQWIDAASRLLVFNGDPVDLDINGTVLDDLGFTSITYRFSSLSTIN